MKRAGLTAMLAVAAMMAWGCEREESQVSTYDPKYDGITPNKLAQPVDTAILEDQKQVARNAAPAPTPAAPAATTPAETAPAETAPATPAAPTEPTPEAAPAAPAAPVVPPPPPPEPGI